MCFQKTRRRQTHNRPGKSAESIVSCNNPKLDCLDAGIRGINQLPLLHQVSCHAAGAGAG